MQNLEVRQAWNAVAHTDDYKSLSVPGGRSGLSNRLLSMGQQAHGFMAFITRQLTSQRLFMLDM